MNPIVNTIANRLSLRAPQRESLEILERVCDLLPLEKGADLAQELKSIQSAFPSVEDFERDFPSLCFALATGVGKTRLMGAFIAYLFEAERIRHFFVLAPNLTIYNKLIEDFDRPSSPKYVFQGLSAFAVNRPLIVTGDNYESGCGVRKAGELPGFESEHAVHVNIFNISKITSTETPKGATKSNVPRFRRLHEYIGESYFEYLSKLDDLVLIMDESHRYRASAGMKAIGELSPVLGLELTATPQVERAGGVQAFKNVIYAYPLSNAMADGFVKEPAVATRENFDPRNYDAAGLERLKLEDGVRIHEETKVQLEVYARNNAKERVKPFMLVIARDTDHANALVKTIEDTAFFEGRYKGKVITVHSNLKGEERDETVEQLIHVERPDNPTEIVVHVNMLKEGWDVTNLYTIVPLRAANSRTLVEQSIGRGLRLPHGRRTGVGAVDRLTIVSHDRFQEIVDYANSQDSIIRGGLKVAYVTDERSQVVVVQPEIVARIGGAGEAPTDGGQRWLFESPQEQAAARATLEVIPEFEHLPRSADLMKPEIQQRIVERVKALVMPAQGVLEGVAPQVDIAKVVADTIGWRNELSIDIPRITLAPVGECKRGYREFALDLSRLHLQPVENEILIQELHRREQHRLASGTGILKPARPEDYLVFGLVNFDDICYDEHATLLYKLAGQVITYLRSYLKNEDEVLNVLQYHQQALVSLVHAQMQDHFQDKAVAYEAHVSKGFTPLRPNNHSARSGEKPRDFRVPVPNKHDIQGMLFSGFQRCLYRTVKFDSDPERRFAAILENKDEDVLKWFRPAKGDIQIYYAGDSSYEPDFIVETKTEKLICETKAGDDMKHPEVQAKAEAAASWCEAATKHAKDNGGKPWMYLLVPDDAIKDNMTLRGLAATYTYKAASKASTPAATAETVRKEPFRRVSPKKGEMYRTCVPILDLKVAAGPLDNSQAVGGEDWAELDTRHKLGPGMFVAQVFGHSMEPRIQDRDWCLFKGPVEGGRKGRVVLVEHRDIADPETGGSYTIKRYDSDKDGDGAGSWRHSEVRLIPDNAAFAPIVLRNVRDDELRVIAVLVDVIR